MAEWQPIETAPKPRSFGPYILVCGPGCRVDLAFWDDGGQYPTEDAGWYSATNHNECGHQQLQPTHWMSLPEPPANARPD